ncbi:MAG: hypothetical protein KDC34_07180 [Saprospiraceae bacterium]|nr:hypothetical protein [Saprospiraceae bacterium]
MFKLLPVLFLFSTAFCQAQVRVAIEFGEPTQDCEGRGQLCQLEPFETNHAQTREAEGVLELKQGQLCLIFSTDLKQEFLPNGYCELKKSLSLAPELMSQLGLKAGQLVIPAGRYAVSQNENSIRF